jgi:hypothetical protein
MMKTKAAPAPTSNAWTCLTVHSQENGVRGGHATR